MNLLLISNIIANGLNAHYVEVYKTGVLRVKHGLVMVVIPMGRVYAADAPHPSIPPR